MQSTLYETKEVSKRKTLSLLLRAANGDILAKTLFFIERSKSVKRGNSDDIIALCSLYE